MEARVYSKYWIIQIYLEVCVDLVKAEAQPRIVISTSSGLTPKVAAKAFFASAIVVNVRSPGLPVRCGGGIGSATRLGSCGVDEAPFPFPRLQQG